VKLTAPPAVVTLLPQETTMATLTIRNIDDATEAELRRRAAERGVTVEEVVHQMLAENIPVHPRHARKPRIDEMTRLGVKPLGPFNLKTVSDTLWDDSSL
jgi:antitoxin FitA